MEKSNAYDQMLRDLLAATFEVTIEDERPTAPNVIKYTGLRASSVSLVNGTATFMLYMTRDTQWSSRRYPT